MQAVPKLRLVLAERGFGRVVAVDLRCGRTGGGTRARVETHPAQGAGRAVRIPRNRRRLTVVSAVNVDSLPPTQQLILDVLAARHRLGEQLWTFPAKGMRRPMDALANAGLIGWKSGVTEGTVRAWLTEAGRDAVLYAGYEPPKQRPAAAIMSWDCRQQPDLDELAGLLRNLTGGGLHLHSADTGSDEYGIVLSTVSLDEVTATTVWRERWNAGEYGIFALGGPKGDPDGQAC